MVPENIHTPTTEGIGNSRGMGGQKPRKFQRGGGEAGGGGGGGLTVKLTSRWFNSILYQHSCYKIATYQLWWNVLKFEGERGGYCFLEKMENPGRWRGGVEEKFPPWWGYGYFLEPRNIPKLN